MENPCVVMEMFCIRGGGVGGGFARLHIFIKTCQTAHLKGRNVSYVSYNSIHLLKELNKRTKQIFIAFILSKIVWHLQSCDQEGSNNSTSFDELETNKQKGNKKYCSYSWLHSIFPRCVSF